MLKTSIVASNRVGLVALIGLRAVLPLLCGMSVRSSPAEAGYVRNVAAVYQVRGRFYDQRKLDF